MMITEPELKTTPLHERHLAARAKMVPFGGWDMPLQYAEGILAEYQAVRGDVALFDTSHMGEFLVEGGANASGLDRIVTQAVAGMATGNCLYGLMLNEQGGVLDDLIVYRLAAERWMVVVNAATMERDERHFRHHLAPEAGLTNLSWQLGKLDLQGPRSREVLAALAPGIKDLEYYTFAEFPLLGENVIISRTGYTGELGYEIYFPWEGMPRLWDALIDRGVTPAGLGARDILRMEMGYPLYGHELDEMTTPSGRGLDRFIAWDKDFIGKANLLREKAQGIRTKLVAFVSASRRAPRAGQPVRSPEGREIGAVTSGTFSPALARGVGLGYVAADAGEAGHKVLIGDPAYPIEAQITKKPLYQHGTFKS